MTTVSFAKCHRPEPAQRFHPSDGVVCTENPHVMVMQPAKDGVRLDASGPLNRARDWRIFIQ